MTRTFYHITCHCGNTGVERTPNTSQHTKLTLEKKILPPLLPGFKLTTFQSRVLRSYQQAIAAHKLWQLSKVKHFLNAHARKQFCPAHIQSFIDYASTLWDSASANTLEPLSSIHRRALKSILLKSTTLTAHDYKSLDILPLKSKLEYNKGIMMHKIVRDSAPLTRMLYKSQ